METFFEFVHEYYQEILIFNLKKETATFQS